MYIRFLGKWDNIIRENEAWFFCGGRGRVNHAGIQNFFFPGGGGWNRYLSLPGRGGGGLGSEACFR